MKIENVDRSCGDCVHHLIRRYDALLHSARVSDEDLAAMKLKPKEPVGWRWLSGIVFGSLFAAFGLIFIWAVTGSPYSSITSTTPMGARVVILLLGLVCSGVGALGFWIGVPEFVQFISCDIIGYPEYVFRDGDGRLHIHLEMPMNIPGVSSGAPHFVANGTRFVGIGTRKGIQKLSETAKDPDAKRELVIGPILKLRVGGWFRKCAIPGDGCWSMGRCWNGFKDLRIRDNKGVEVDCATLAPEQVLMIIRGYVSVRNILDNVERLASAENTTHAACVAAKADRDHLGVAIMTAIARMARDRKTLGASKHAQRIREQFEQALALLPTSDPDAREAIVMRWAEEAKKIVLAEEAEKAAAAAAPPSAPPPAAAAEEKPAPVPAADADKSPMPDRDGMAT